MNEIGVQTTGERGSALVLAIFAIFLLAAMGITLLFLADSDVKMNQAGLRAKKSFYLAEAGLEEARKALRAANVASSNPAGLSDELVVAAGTGSPSAIEADPTTIAPVYNSAGIATSFTGYGNDVPLVANTALGTGRYTAFLTNDAVDGWATKTDTNDRVMITAIGAGADRSVEMVQAIVEITELPALPATVTMLGPAPSTFVGGNSSSKIYSGNDCVGATGYTGVANLHMPVVGTMNSASQASVAASVTADDATYQSTPESGANTVDDSSTTSDPRWTVTADPMWNDCQAVKALAASVKSAADYICTSSQPCSHWGTSTTSTVTYAEGNLNPGTGKGLLWVTGTLTINGATSWEGTIYVVGTGQFLRSGGGSGHTWGGIMVGDIAGPDNVFGTADDCTGPSAGFSAASFDTSGGGGHQTIYCSDIINKTNAGLPIAIEEFRQR